MFGYLFMVKIENKLQMLFSDYIMNIYNQKW